MGGLGGIGTVTERLPEGRSGGRGLHKLRKCVLKIKSNVKCTSSQNSSDHLLKVGVFFFFLRGYLLKKSTSSSPNTRDLKFDPRFHI